jgi:hypothetical protein
VEVLVVFDAPPHAAASAAGKTARRIKRLNRESI